MSIDQWLASTGAAWLVPVGILLGVLAGVLSERDVDPEGTADSGLGRLVVRRGRSAGSVGAGPDVLAPVGGELAGDLRVPAADFRGRAVRGVHVTLPARRGRAQSVAVLTVAVAAVFVTSCTGAVPEPVVTEHTASVGTGVVAESEVFNELPYAAVSPSQVLHLSLPDQTGDAVPAVVLVHGGGFSEGSRGDVRFLVEALNARGYATAAIDYRLSGEALFPAAVQDVTSAIRWVRANAAAHGIDPDRIAVWGLSAGGNLAAMAAVTADRGTLADPDDRPADSGDPPVTGAVQAVVAWYAPMDFGTIDAQGVDPGGCPDRPGLHDPADSVESRYLGAALPAAPELVRASAPATYLDGVEGMPPFYLAHGDRDCIVPFAQTLEFADAVRAAGGQVSVDIVAGAGHATAEINRAQVPPSIDFLDDVLNVGS